MIFPWLWRVLPGSRLLKVLQISLICSLIVFGLFAVVFPQLSGLINDSPVIENSITADESFPYK